jgi:hypothetical protein
MGFGALLLGTSIAGGVWADELVGPYVGGSVGDSNVRSQGYANVDYYAFDKTHAAWKVFGGIRPIGPLGLEAEYIDFGHPNAGANYSYVSADSHAQAGAVFVVGYLPLPAPFLEAFAKVGAARLHQTTNVNYPASCIPNQPCAQYFGLLHQDNWTSAAAYGGGVQAKFDRIALRAEYERISRNNGEPDLFSVGASWQF